jgi:hypothetical protein
VLGQDTLYVLENLLGYKKTDIDCLKNKNII